MDLTVEALRLGMVVARGRAGIASDNIAHVDTEGFRAQRGDFGSALGLLQSAAADPGVDARALHQAAMDGSAHPITTDAGQDGPVQLDGEVADLESASADYQALSSVLSRRFSLMQLALAGKG